LIFRLDGMLPVGDGRFIAHAEIDGGRKEVDRWWESGRDCECN